MRQGSSHKNIASNIAIVFILLLFFIPKMVWGQGEKRDSIIQQSQLLDSLAEYNFDQGNDSLALELSRQSLNIRRNIYGENHPNYAKTLCHMAQYLNELGYYQEAMDSISKAMDIQKKTLGMIHLDYGRSLSIYADISSSMGNYKGAIDLKTEALKVFKESCGEDVLYYIPSLIDLAEIYNEIGNYQKTSDLCEQVLRLYELNLWDKYASDYARTLLVYSKTKSVLGSSKEAIKLCKNALEIYKSLYGEIHIFYATAQSILGNIYADSYNFQESVRLELSALKIYKEHYGENHFYYALSLFNLAEYYYYLNESDKALSFVNNAKDVFESLFGKRNSYYIASLQHIIKYYNELGLYKKAAEIAKSALEIGNEWLNEDSCLDVSVLYNIAECAYCLGDYKTALSYGEKTLELQKDYYGSDNLTYADILNALSVYYAKMGLYDKAFEYEKESLDIYANKVLNSFTGNSIFQSQNLWRGLQNRFINYVGLFYRHPVSSLLPDLYNRSALFAKSLLLNVDMGLRKVIYESKDSVLIHSYSELSSNRDILNKLEELPLDEHFMDTDSLKDIIQKQDANLIIMSKEYGDYMRNLRFTWKDIQNNLKGEDVAIEFLDFPVGTDSIIYVALTIQKDSEFPKITILFEEKQLKQIADTLCYQSKDMTQLIWGPLFPELQGVKNIYFSPSGALYNIGIEYLPVMEDYNIYRLSSTRELVNRGEINANNHAVLYGGLDYYAIIDTTNSIESQTITNGPYKERANVRGMGLRGGKEYLKHTKIEVDRIGEELNKAKWICMLDTASLGTEESFKMLSGKKTNVLHIATHGFYYTKEEVDDRGYQFMLLDDQRASVEDKALTRTGLIMSGANHILEGEELPENVEDGILTAKEIADVDLRGLDLVVLSACQTGLGDISQGEGVFGLQRGFKKAGANSILMSLWEVNDEATQILMTQFYKNLVSGQSKRQSLQSAQKYLREYNAGQYNKPEYWAAFILLDGIEKN